MKLHSKRLSKVAWMVEEHKQGTILADIGTDHAYLPCFLLDENIITSAYACDVAEGPLSSSKETIQSLHLELLDYQHPSLNILMNYHSLHSNRTQLLRPFLQQNYLLLFH